MIIVAINSKLVTIDTIYSTLSPINSNNNNHCYY